MEGAPAVVVLVRLPSASRRKRVTTVLPAAEATCGGIPFLELHQFDAAHCIDSEALPAAISIFYPRITLQKNNALNRVDRIETGDKFIRFKQHDSIGKKE
jgi:hypothetical protein